MGTDACNYRVSRERFASITARRDGDKQHLTTGAPLYVASIAVEIGKSEAQLAIISR